MSAGLPGRTRASSGGRAQERTKPPALPVLAPAPSGPGLRCQHLLLHDSQGCGSPISHPFQHPTKAKQAGLWLPEGRVALCQPQAGLGDSSLRLSMPGACSRSEPLYCHPDRPCCPVREWACCPQHRVLVDQRAAGGYRCAPDDAATPLLGSDRFCTHKPLHADIARPSLGGQLGAAPAAVASIGKVPWLLGGGRAWPRSREGLVEQVSRSSQGLMGGLSPSGLWPCPLGEEEPWLGVLPVTSWGWGTLHCSAGCQASLAL